MSQWNAVVSVYEYGWKEVFERLGAFGHLTKNPFLNVLLLITDYMPALLHKLWEGMGNDPASWSFLSRLIAVSHTFSFQFLKFD
jgi:hypothetical protein